MLIPDSNVLVHAANEDAREYAASRNWLLDALRGREPVGLAWSTILAFVRLSTHPRIFSPPLTVERSIALVKSWLSAPAGVLIEPTVRHLTLLHGLLHDVGVAGNLVNDAHLAALALEHDATVISFDRDFARFEGVRWRMPA